MDILRVALFGGVRISHNNWATQGKLTREIQELLAYLLLHRDRMHPREVLADVFWGDSSQEKARRALNTAWWRLKKELEPQGIAAGTYLISASAGEVGFNRESEYWLDIEIFEQSLAELLIDSPSTLAKTDEFELERTLRLYAGELLEGFYNEWVLMHRERLRALYLKGLVYLVGYNKFHALYEEAIACGQHILSLDPIREDIHRELMRLYLQSGQRPLAARQYARCQLTLAKELGISPMEETQRLYAEIFPEVRKGSRPPAGEESLRFNQALEQLRQLSHTIDIAREQVEQTLEVFTSYTRLED